MIIVALLFKGTSIGNNTFLQYLNTDLAVARIVSILALDMAIEFFLSFTIPALMKASNITWREIKFMLNSYIYLRSNAGMLLTFFSFAIFLSFYYIQVDLVNLAITP